MSGKNVKVGIKVRPFLHKKKDQNTQNFWKIVDNSIQAIDCNAEPFYFDHIFDQDASNQTIFDTMAKHIVVSAIKGFNGTIFAYGQTSSGKTYTMMGDNRNPGVMVLAAKEIFKEIAKASDRQFLLRVGYIEIYNEKVNDLLDKGNRDLKIQDIGNGDVMVPCEEVIITSEDNFLKHLLNGNKQRKIGETNMNERSSRSHAIFRVIIESRKVDLSEDDSVQLSILNLVDLAGSERADQTGATGSRLKEGAHINKSLMFLSLVIKSLSENDSYINYRDSKLTRILQASLGGNALTAIICTIKPTVMEETWSTLSFAMRAKTVKNKPHVNESVKDATMMKRLEKEISRLQSELEEERKKTESQLKISMLEKRLHDTYLKFVNTSSVLASQKTAEQRRRTWCPSSSTEDSDSSIPLPINADSKFSVPMVPKKKTSQHLPKPNCFFTPQVVMSRGDEFETPSNGISDTALNTNTIDEEFVPAEDVNFGEDFLTPVNSPRTSLNVLRRGSMTPKMNIYQIANKVEREFEELQHFTNLETQLKVEHNNYGMLKSKLEDAEKAIIRLQQERAEYVFVKEQCKESENNLKSCRERCTELESKVADYEEVISVFRTKIVDLEKENQNAVSLEFEFKGIKNKSEIREKELLDVLNEKEKVITKLESSVQSLSAKLQESYKEACSELKTTEETNITRTQLQTLQSEYYKMQEKCNEQNRIINTVQSEYKEIKIKYKNLLDKYDKLEANSILTTKEYTALQAANDELQNEIRKLKLSVEHTQTFLLKPDPTNSVNHSDEIPSLKATNQQLKEELEEIQMKFDNLQKEYEEVSSELVDNLQDNEDIRKKCMKIEEELMQLKGNKPNLSAKEVQTDIDDNSEAKLSNILSADSTTDYLANVLQTIELTKEIEIDLSSSTGKKQIFKTSSIENETILRRLLIQNISNIRIANNSDIDDMHPLMQGVMNFKIIEECKDDLDSLETAIESTSGSRQSCDSLETIEVTNKKSQDYLIDHGDGNSDEYDDDGGHPIVLDSVGQNIVKLINDINRYEDKDKLLTIVDEIVCKIMEILSTMHTSDENTNCLELMHGCCEYSKLFNKLYAHFLSYPNKEKEGQFHDTSHSILVDNKIQQMNSFNVIIKNLRSEIEEKESLETQLKQQIEEWKEKYNLLESKFRPRCDNDDQKNNQIQVELSELQEKYVSLQKEFMENEMRIMHLELGMKLSTSLWKEKCTMFQNELQTKETLHVSELLSVDNKFSEELHVKTDLIEKLEKQLLENNAKIDELERRQKVRNTEIPTTNCQELNSLENEKHQEEGDSKLIEELKENLGDLQQQLECANEKNTSIDLLMKKILEEKSNLEKKIVNLTKQSKESESLKKEKQDLQIECEKYQKEILNLKKSIDSLNKEKEDFEPIWQRLQTKNMQLQNAIDDLNESIEKHKTTCDNLKREKLSLQTAMTHLKLEKQEQHEMCENLRRKFLDIEEIQVEKESTNSDYDELEKEREILEDERNKLLLANHEILTEKDSLSNENQKLQNLVKTYTEDMKLKEKSLNEFQEKYDKQVRENENLRANMEKLKSELDKSTKEFSEEIANLQDVIKMYTENLKNLESKNTDLLSKLESLSNDLKSAQSKMSDYMNLKSQYDESTLAHQTETDTLKSRLETIETQLIEERSTLLKRSKEFENRFNELELRCKSMNANNSELQDINKTLHENLEKADKDAKRCQSLRSEIDSMKLELISREKSLTQLNMENQKISNSKLELRTKLEATIKEANMDIERCKHEILQLSETKFSLSEQVKRLQNTLHYKESTFMAKKETFDKTVAELVADKKHLEEKMLNSLSKIRKLEQELNDIKQIHGASGGASPPKRKTVDLLLSENQQLKIKNNSLIEKLESSSHTKAAKNEERKNRRLSAHDERRRHSFIGSSHDISTMTDPTDIRTDIECNCEELDRQVKSYQKQIIICNSQISKLAMELKNNPFKAENVALKKRLQDEDDRQRILRIEIKKYKHLVDKANDAATEAIALVQTKTQLTDIDVQTAISSNDMEELMKLHGKNEDLKKICRSRLSRLKEMEKEIAEFEIFKKKYADLKILLQIRAEEIASLKETLAEKATT